MTNYMPEWATPLSLSEYPRFELDDDTSSDLSTDTTVCARCKEIVPNSEAYIFYIRGGDFCLDCWHVEAEYIKMRVVS